MEYLPSRSLAEVLTEDGVLRVDQAAQVGAQVADALAATHAAGIVHRDVKPANILIGEGGSVEGLVKITDFGISHAIGDVTLTQTGQITGTPAFLAPEVAQGHPMTEASDVFSLGATLYTCLEGTPPFGMEDNPLGMLHRVAGGQVVPPQRSGALTQPLQRILATDPADRPTMPEVRDELAKLAAGRDGDTTTILLARTDVGSAAPGRTRTTSFPAGAGAAAEAPAPVASPPPAPPARPAAAARPAAPPPPPRQQPPERGRRRGRGLWVAAALIALVLVGLIALWTLDPFSGDGTAASGSSGGASSSAAATSPSASEPAPSSSAETSPSESAGTPVDAGTVKGSDVERAVKDFFKGIPNDLQAAYALTSPGFQSQHPYESFSGFWQGFKDAKVDNIRTEDGSTSATVDITYVKSDNSRQTEQHLLSFVPGDDGSLLLDDDTYQSQVG
jgi:serine/threonine protein kinase